MNENIDFDGIYKVERIKNGKVTHKYTQKNRILQSGLNLMASLLGNTSSYRLKSIAVGTSEQIVTAIDTKLENPVKKDITFTTQANVVSGIAIFLENEANQHIGEFGIYDTNNILISRSLNREVFEKVTGEQLRVTWSLTISYKESI